MNFRSEAYIGFTPEMFLKVARLLEALNSKISL